MPSFLPTALGRSEWFDAADEILEHIDVLRAGIDDPWARYALWRSQEAAPARLTPETLRLPFSDADHSVSRNFSKGTGCAHSVPLRVSAPEE
jgi:hypothetical protein